MSDAIEQVEEARPRRFRPYTVYKDSGVEWLGQIPMHWNTRRLKYLVTVNDEDLPESTDPSLEISYVDISSVDAVAGITAIEVMAFEDAPTRARRIVRKGDVIVSTVRTYLRAIAAIESQVSNLIVSTGFAVIRPRQLDSTFASYVFRAPHFVERVVANSVGVSYPAISASGLACLAIAYPEIDEQRAIVTFLDREIAKIDALLAKKERLTELLQEKRIAVITRAVTRGLDSGVPMKPSGVGWLGEIPVHWNVKRIKHGSSKIGSGKTPSGGAEVYVLQGVMLLRSQNIHFGGLQLDDVAFIDTRTDAEMYGSRVQEYDVLLNITGASLGRCCVAYLGDMQANVNQHVCIIRPRSDVFDSAFLAASIASESLQAQVFNNENGVSRDALNFEQVGELVVAEPPLEEQQEIANSIHVEGAKIDVLLDEVCKAIDYLREFRTALISAAVIGKIDVREETT